MATIPFSFDNRSQPVNTGSAAIGTLTGTGTSDAVEVIGVRRVAIGVNNGADNACTFTVEGSLDGTNFDTVAYGTGSSAAYTQDAHTTAAAGKDILYLPSDDFIRYVRVNVSAANANGTAFTVYGG